MPSDTTGLQEFAANFKQQLQSFAQELAEYGEGVLQNHGVWENGDGLLDTGSLRASITGYADDGDPHHNEGDPEWQTTRREGNINGRRARQAIAGERSGYHYNPPSNYDPVPAESISSNADATAVVTAWVKYGQDDPIEPQVVSAFLDTLNQMARYALSPTMVYRNFFDQPSDIHVSVPLNAPQNPNQG